MNAILLTIILIPVIEIYLFIEIGGKIGAIYTISLIFITAVIGIYYARYEGFNTLRSGMGQMMRNELPIYEIVSGAALAFAALLLVIPGFATDLVGFFMIFPPTRKVIFYKFSKKYSKEKKLKEDFIEGESEDIDDKNEQ
tara:strand:- start:504 stop:923 length:420 start_codon:yes stop_codon:yes gene_type:complete